MSETVEKHSPEHSLESRRGRLAKFFGKRATREIYDEPQLDLRELMEELPNSIEMGGELAQQLEAAMRQNTVMYRGDEVHNFRINEDEVAKTVYFRLSEAGREIGADVADWTVSFPVDSFVGAPGLSSWSRGRQGPKDRKNGTSSQRIINRYAKKSKSTASPLKGALAAVLPDGRCALRLLEDGSHRLAAAKKRGDQTVPVSGLVAVVLLKPGADLGDFL